MNIQKSFTREYILANCGCYARDKMNSIDLCSFMEDESEFVTLSSIIESEIPLKDKYWFVCNHINDECDKIKLIEYVYNRVISYVGNLTIENGVIKEALSAAVEYLRGIISETVKKERLHFSNDTAFAVGFCADNDYTDLHDELFEYLKQITS